MPWYGNSSHWETKAMKRSRRKREARELAIANFGKGVNR